MSNTTENTIRVAIYARVANADQLELNRQVKVCSEYAEHTPNYSVVAKYTDLNHSGRTKDRAGFQQMMLDAEQGKFDLIIASDLARFSRDLRSIFVYAKELRKAGVSVCFVRECLFSDDTDFECRLSVLVAFQQEESRRQSQKVKYGQMVSRANGTVFGTGNVLGYDKVDGNYVINPDQADTVRLIFDLCIEGYGVGKICNTLNEQGKITSTGKAEWHKTTVARILKNPVYCGKICYPRSNEVIDGSHEPIVTEEIFNKANQMMQERSPSK